MLLQQWRDTSVEAVVCQLEIDQLRTAIAAALQSATEEQLTQHPGNGKEWQWVEILREAISEGKT